MMSYRLLITYKGSSRPISLEGKRWLIGRGTHSTIPLADPLVSRRHAVLYLEGETLWVQDLGAKNPIEVNGTVVRDRTALKVGDRLLLGESVALLQAREIHSARISKSDSSSGLSHDNYLRHDGRNAKNPILRLLNQLADSLQPVTNLEDAAQLTLKLLSSAFPCRRVVIARLRTGGRLEVLAAEGVGPNFAVSSQLLAALRKEQTPIRLATPSAATAGRRGSEEAVSIEELGILAAPVLVSGRLDGFLYLESGSVSAIQEDGDGTKDETHAATREPETRELRPKTSFYSHLDLLACISRIYAARVEILQNFDLLRQERHLLEISDRQIQIFLAAAPSTQRIQRDAEDLADRRSPVAIHGEKGSGRESLARYIHSCRRSSEIGSDLDLLRPYVIVDTARAGEEGFAEELFGEALEVAGDSDAQDGLLVRASGGTLCIREVERLPREIQSQLVAYLSKGRIRVGDKDRLLDVRLIVTSSLSREELISTALTAGLSNFLGPDHFEVPPLRQRLEDIPLLTTHFLESAAKRRQEDPVRVSPRAMDLLRGYAWPANVTELRDVLETGAVIARDHTIYPKQLPPEIVKADTSEPRSPEGLKSLKEVEYDYMLKVLDAVGGNKSIACKVLGIAYSTLHDRLKNGAPSVDR